MAPGGTIGAGRGSGIRGFARDVRMVLRHRGTLTLRKASGLSIIEQAHYIKEWERECSRRRKKGKQTRHWSSWCRRRRRATLQP